ncbi:MAG TPA: CBS domain-containing protein [Egibacteraceae bacterium]|nr:CBS domain-containing protein [Egibacteraceae bacterium]
MRVRDCMTTAAVTVGPDHTLRQAAQVMAQRNTGAALVLDPDGAGPGIITERDVLRSVAADEDPDREIVREHLTPEVTVTVPDADLRAAATAMINGGFRHLVVVSEDSQVLGMLSIRDIVRSWVQEPTPVG